jgi:metallo-beta-lactamase family protein
MSTATRSDSTKYSNEDSKSSTEKPRIRFLGAAQTVTGSKYLITYNHQRILVDCGLFQGLKELRLKNWDRFPVDPKTISAIVLTHAHIDHSGYIPRLIKEGFTGKVYCADATKALCKILLPDTGYLQQEEAEFLNRRRLSKHKPALPLFSEKEAENSLDFFESKSFSTPFQIAEGIEATFLYAGHILGAAQVVLRLGETTIGFSGDLGRPNDAILMNPEPMKKVDYLVMESTYGNRTHEDSDPSIELEKIINQAVKNKSVVVIPSFAVGRAQMLLYYLHQLKSQNKIPDIPMYLNSPMATNVTQLLKQFRSLHKLSIEKCDEICSTVKYVKSVEESKWLNEQKGPMVIISASGMATGGRILHHLKAFAGDPKNFIVLAGFQAAGTRGRSLQDGSQEIKIFRELIPVRAKVEVLENLSAHADGAELTDWLNKSKISPKNIFVTHGESQASQFLAQKLRTELGFNCTVPIPDREYDLD